MRVDTLGRDVIISINESIPYKMLEGLSSDANLDFAIYRTAKTRGINRKAAILMKSIIEGHPFKDGNKRTGFIAAKTLLELNGKTWDIIHEYTKEAFALGVATKNMPINKMAEWFANHTRVG